MKDTPVKPCFVGIDVSKDTLDFYFLPQQKHWQTENRNFSNLCKRLALYHPKLIVMEPTGGYEMPLYKALVDAGFRVCRENPRQIHHFRKSQGKWGKTDSSDARVIAHYAQAHADTLEPQPLEESQEELRQLTSRRSDLVKMQTMEKNRFQVPNLDEPLRDSCQRVLRFLEKEIGLLDEAIEAKILSRKDWRKKHRLLQSVPGIAETGARTLLAHLPELGAIGSKQIAALAGVAPYHNCSGQYQGKSHVQGGRGAVRACLFMATLTAIAHNPAIKAFYKQLLNRGKAKKVAIVACMHKLLRILNAMLKQDKSFEVRLIKA